MSTPVPPAQTALGQRWHGARSDAIHPLFLRLLLGLLSLILASPGWAHDPFESTAVSRLQHGRLEVVLTMTTQMGGVLARSAEDPSAPTLNATTFPDYRERLERGARRLYEVTAGGGVLVPQRTAARLAEGGHVEIALIYPRPSAWPLRFRSRAIEKVPGSYTADFAVFDEDEKLLGRKFFTPQNIATAELSIGQAAGPMAEAAPVWMAANAPATPESPRPAAAAPPGPRGPWFALGTAGALVVIAAGLAALLLHKPRKPAL